LFLATPHGVRLAEVGHHCDSANDPVTSKIAVSARRNCLKSPLRENVLLQPRTVGAIMQVAAAIPKRRRRVSEKIMLEMTGGVAWI
jgi:hypothetical protein